MVTRISLQSDGSEYPRVIKPKLLALPSAKEAAAIATVREDFVKLIRGSDVVVDIEETDTPPQGGQDQAPPSDTWDGLTDIQKAARPAWVRRPDCGAGSSRTRLAAIPSKEQFAEVRALIEEYEAIAAAGGVGDDLPF